MQRRDFIGKTFAAAGMAGFAAANLSMADATSSAREFYELRLYHLRRGSKQKLFDDYVREAGIPAMNRAGVPAVGVFNVMIGPDSPTVYVLLPHRSMDSFIQVGQRLKNDTEYQKAGAEFINAPATDPVYVRMESSLMISFEGMPHFEAPTAAREKKPRIYELRCYESHSKKAHQKKVEMFNIGEISIFRRTGLTPVFFGETVIGARMPNLTYMLTFENIAERDKNWSTFAGDPEWKKLSSTPGYTDPEIVSNISNVLLRPASYSQI